MNAPFETSRTRLSRPLPIFPQVDRYGWALRESDRLPLLVAGIAGVAGYNGYAWFRQKYGESVIGQRPVRNWPLSGPGILGVDLESTRAIRRVIAERGIRTVLNCGGSCALKSCELDPEMAYRVNVRSVESLLDAIDGLDVRLVHLSIDLVYSGARGGWHVESDPVDPVTVYGQTMVLAEERILERCPEACILRISLPMGISFNGHAGAIDWIQSRFAAGKPATLYYDEVRTPTYVECLLETIESVLASDLKGRFHAGGPRPLTLFEIAQIVNRVGGYDPELLQGCYRLEAGPVPPRAGNVTMVSERLARAVGRVPFAPWPLDERCVPDHRVHLSIDLVYSGARGGWHVESDPVDPVTVYGQTMVLAEERILERCPEACILRISLPMGISFNGHAGAIDWIQSRFAAGKPATLYYDEVRTPTYVECLLETIESVLASDLKGRFHAGGPRPLTLFEIAQIVNRVGGYDPELLQGCYRLEAGPVPPRAGNVTMVSERLARAVGRVPFAPWPLDERCVPDHRRWHFERDADWGPGSKERIRETLYFRSTRGHDDEPSDDGQNTYTTQ